MYLHLELKVVPVERQTEAIGRLTALHTLMSKSPGFNDAQILRYMGKASQYIVVRSWESAQAHAGYRASDAAKEFGSQRVPGLYSNLLVQDWECEIDSKGSGAGDYVVRSLFQVPEGRWPEFIEDRKRHDELALQVPGVASLRTYRCTSTGEHQGEAFVLARRADRNSYNAFLESQQAATYRKSRPEGLYTRLASECYEVVGEVR